MITPEDLYRRHAPDVFRFAFWLSGNRAEAEDLTSETFLRVWTHTRPLRAATVKGFLFTIARNLYLNRRRRAGRQGGNPAPDVPDPAPGPGRSAQARDELRRALDGLAALPEADRAALLMRAEHGLPYDEIAAALGTTAGAARVRVHRARLKLAARLDPDGENPCKSPAT